MIVVVTVYLLIGLVFGLAFVVWGYSALQPDAKGSRLSFRLLLLPANLLLWPYLMIRWLMTRRPGGPQQSTGQSTGQSSERHS